MGREHQARSYRLVQSHVQSQNRAHKEPNSTGELGRYERITPLSAVPDVDNQQR